MCCRCPLIEIHTCNAKIRISITQDPKTVTHGVFEFGGVEMDLILPVP